MRFLIDTNRYSDFARNQSDVVSLFANADEILVPYVVVAELRAGFRSGTCSLKNESVLMRFLSNERVTVLYPDEGTTCAYADLYAQLRKNGTPIPTNDLWIAALAVQHALPLATRDVHFNFLPQLARI